MYNVLHSIGENSLGGGISLYDFNQDGLDDLTLATGKGELIGFYVNRGDYFERLEPLVNNREDVKQISWVDFDNDHDPDLYISAYGGVSKLYLNVGKLEMVEYTEESGLPLIEHKGFGAIWGDYNRDGWLDLYYASKGTGEEKSYNRLFKNNANGTFTEVTETSGASDEGKFPFCASFIDYNNDMWPDIYVANDKLTTNTLLKNNKGNFEDVSNLTGADVKMNAMCVTPGDYNQDGWIDIYITNTPVGSYLLQNSGIKNENGYYQFNNVAELHNVHFPGGNGWGSNFLDADNDGDQDLYVSSSISQPKELSSAFYENIGGSTFQSPEIAGFLKDTAASYTNAIGDLNNDGLVDIVVNNNLPARFHIWENKTINDHHWIKIHLKGIMSNTEGVGAKIEIYTDQNYQMQFTTCGQGYLAQNSSYIHFGTGSSTTIDSLTVTWPTGHIDQLYNIDVDQLLQIHEGSSKDGIISPAPGIKTKPWSPITSVDIHRNQKSEIFPNPGTDRLIIISELFVKQAVLIDLLGKKRVVDINSKSATIDTNGLCAGVYYIKLHFNHTTETLKWVKY
ncbi:MAG: FG-GAP-like repeat-containing protein [Fulvivirga sp.]|nr:FG-GAP-like repeat-containing protein [Fulvivirga sp.]